MVRSNKFQRETNRDESVEIRLTRCKRKEVARGRVKTVLGSRRASSIQERGRAQRERCQDRGGKRDRWCKRGGWECEDTEEAGWGAEMGENEQ